MKKLLDISVEVEDSYDADTVGQIVTNAVSKCNTDNGFVNLVKVHVGNVRMKQLSDILKYLHDALESHGIDNVILIPISDCVTDITIEEIRCTYGLND